MAKEPRSDAGAAGNQSPSADASTDPTLSRAPEGATLAGGEQIGTAAVAALSSAQVAALTTGDVAVLNTVDIVALSTADIAALATAQVGSLSTADAPAITGAAGDSKDASNAAPEGATDHDLAEEPEPDLEAEAAARAAARRQRERESTLLGLLDVALEQDLSHDDANSLVQLRQRFAELKGALGRLQLQTTDKVADILRNVERSI